MVHRRWRMRFSVIGLAVGVGLLVTGCLGQDYLDQPLSFSEWDHGWLGVIDSGEMLDVGLRENPSYPGAEWQIVEFDASVLTLEESLHAPSPRPAAPDDQQSLLAGWVFIFSGASVGESTLAFEIRADGERVDLAEFTVSVVEDACATELGISAARCGGDQLDDQGQRGLTEWGSGWSVPIAPEEETTVTLTANAAYPDVSWLVVEHDPSVIEVRNNGTQDARSPGDWDLSDPNKPQSFLSISEFVVTGVDSGESALIFELRIGDRRIEAVEYTAVVADDV